MLPFDSIKPLQIIRDPLNFHYNEMFMKIVHPLINHVMVYAGSDAYKVANVTYRKKSMQIYKK